MNEIQHPQHRLSDLLAGISTFHHDYDPLISGLNLDSRQVKPGDLFFAYPGTVSDGRRYIEQALAQGAEMVLYEPHPDITPSKHCIPVVNIQRHIGTIANRYWARAFEKLTVIGVTGTNGKSTCAYWLSHILQQNGISSAMIGTIGIGPVTNLAPAKLTTPDTISLHRQMAEFANQGYRSVVMEASSHSLMQYRVAGIPFEYAIYTNLSHEHLDYHGTMRDYAQAKSRLFDFASLKGAVINADDEWGNQWLHSWVKSYPLLAYSCKENVKCPSSINRISGRQIHLTDQLHLAMTVHSPWGDAQWQLPVMGEFNAYNALACAGVLGMMGLPWDTISHALSSLPQVPGRMQVWRTANMPMIVVDFAHTPAALENALSALKSYCRGKLWCIFGCGGDRDQAKRPSMGKVAATLADQIILTNDNPRSEVPEAIIQDILSGIPQAISAPYIPDRILAIQTALQQAGAQDVILVAGKGHEATQIIGARTIPYSDIQVIQSLVQQREQAV